MRDEVEFRVFGEGLSDPEVAHNIEKLLGLLAATENFEVERTEKRVLGPEEVFEHDPRGLSRADFARLSALSDADLQVRGRASKAFNAARRVAAGLKVLVNDPDEEKVLIPRSLIEELLVEDSRASKRAYNIGNSSRNLYRQLLDFSRPAQED